MGEVYDEVRRRVPAKRCGNPCLSQNRPQGRSLNRTVVWNRESDSDAFPFASHRPPQVPAVRGAPFPSGRETAGALLASDRGQLDGGGLYHKGKYVPGREAAAVDKQAAIPWQWQLAGIRPRAGRQAHDGALEPVTRPCCRRAHAGHSSAELLRRGAPPRAGGREMSAGRTIIGMKP